MKSESTPVGFDCDKSVCVLIAFVTVVLLAFSDVTLGIGPKSADVIVAVASCAAFTVGFDRTLLANSTPC